MYPGWQLKFSLEGKDLPNEDRSLDAHPVPMLGSEVRFPKSTSPWKVNVIRYDYEVKVVRVFLGRP